MEIDPGRCNPFRVVDPNPIRTQGSAGAQPWAKRLNPFGIRLAAITQDSKFEKESSAKCPISRLGALAPSFEVKASSPEVTIDGSHSNYKALDTISALSRPYGTWNSCRLDPGVETPGYCHRCLRSSAPSSGFSGNATHKWPQPQLQRWGD